MARGFSQVSWIVGLIVAVVVIETIVSLLAHSPALNRSNLLEHRFASEEMLQRAYVYEKLRQLQDSRPDIIQVGDSSGLHGVHPKVVESYLSGRRYLNLSIATNLGHFGYLAIARYMLEHDAGIRTLVLYFSPAGGQPRRILVDGPRLMAEDLHTSLNSPIHRLLSLPSLGLRRDVTDFFYYLNGTLNQRDRPLTSNAGYLMLRDVIGQSGGWAREGTQPEDLLDGIRQSSPAYAGLSNRDILRSISDHSGKVTVDSGFDWATLSTRTNVEIVLDAYRKLAAKHNVRLVVATNPVPESVRTDDFRVLYDMEAIEAALASYRSSHPDVSFLDVEYWPDQKFSVIAHVAAPYSIESSHRLGAFLARTPAALQSPRGDKSELPAADRVVLEMGGNPTTHGLSEPFARDGHSFRRIRTGRYEAVAWARVNPENRQLLSIVVADDLPSDVAKATTVAVFGEPAKRLADDRQPGRLVMRFELPAAGVQRFDGWVELLISTRGLTKWAGNAYRAEATGFHLSIERLTIAAFD